MSGFRWSTLAVAAGCGVLAATAGVAVSSGLAALMDGVTSPVVAVGNRVIDEAPGPLKDWAVETFGENDKPILLAGVGAALVLLAVAAGLVGLGHRRVALGITGGFGLVAIAAAATDRATTAEPLVAALPGVAALLVSVLSLGWMLRRLGRSAAPAHRPLRQHPGDDLPDGFDRRRFLAAVMATGGVAAAGGVVTKLFSEPAAAASRADVTIPAPLDAAGPVPRGVESAVPGVSPYLTPSADFYRVDINLTVPDVPAESWSLRIHGMVDQELVLSYEDLLAERLIERRITLTCVSNQVGGPYVGNTSWVGVPIADLLDRVGVRDGADALLSSSVDDFTVGTPLAAVTDGRPAMIAVAMDGQPLPLEHGFPARMVVPGLYGYVSATKWVTDIEVTRFDRISTYWTDRGWAAEAPIKTSSRIDVPTSLERVPAGAVAFGGVAWAQTTGIEKVESRIDDGEWQPASLATEDTLDTWRQWSGRWDEASPGLHSVAVRATDKSGYTQTSERVQPRPDGSTGWHTIQFTVE